MGSTPTVPIVAAGSVGRVKAVIATRPGGPEVLALADLPDPVPGPGDVLVQVRGSAVNRADLLQRRGLYDPPPGTTPVLGLELVGEVVDATHAPEGPWREGDRVMCLVAGGGNAELAAVPAANCIPVPEGMAWDMAAAIPEVFITAFQGLVRLGRLQAGEIALVHAIASGVGTAAAQVCRAVGARCIGTSRAAGRADAGAPWGAEPLVVTSDGFADDVRMMTGGHGADVILDLVGARYLPANVACLARGGRLVLTGLVGGRVGELDMGAMIAAQATVSASSLRGRDVDDKGRIMQEFAQWAAPLFARGELEPVIDCVLPLAEVAAAHARVEADAAVGKVVLAVP